MDILILIRLGPKKNKKFISGFVFFLARKIIIYYSKKQSIVILFFIKTKYYVLCKTIQKTIWLKQILTGIRYNIPDTKYILIIRNNQKFLLLAENPELSPGLRPALHVFGPEQPINPSEYQKPHVNK
jgi:hypothetical protein